MFKKYRIDFYNGDTWQNRIYIECADLRFIRALFANCNLVYEIIEIK